QSEIDLVLGNGKRPTHIAVPDLSGLNFDEAKFALMGVGLNIRSISSNLDPLDSPDAEVVDQSPKAGQSVSLGAEINFTLTLARTNTPRIAPVLITPVDELNELASVVSFEYDSSKPTPPSYRALEGISRYMRSEMG